jgi:hypothetical protein
MQGVFEPPTLRSYPAVPPELEGTECYQAVAASQLITIVAGVAGRAIAEAISRQPKGHDFTIYRRHRRPSLAGD